MNETAIHQEDLLRENQTLRAQLQEAEELLSALRHHEVDAFVVSLPHGEQVYTLQSTERPYRLLIEQMQEAAITLSAEDIVLYSNPRFAQMLRLPHEQVVVASIHSFVPEGYAAPLQALLREGRMRTGKCEILLRAANDMLIPVQITASPLPSEGEGHLCLVITDLTAQKRNEEIATAEQLARSILEHTAEAIVVCDTEGHILRASRQAHLFAGQNLLLQAFDRVFPLTFESDGEQVLPGKVAPQHPITPLSAALAGETTTGLEACFDRHDGERFHILLTAGPLRSVQGEMLGCVVTLSDITAHKQKEETLRTQQAAITDLNQRLQRAITESHHRIKNNLQILSSLLDMQISDDLESVPISEFERLKLHIRGLASIHDLLTQESKTEGDYGSLSAREAITRLIQTLQVTLGNRYIRCDVEEARISVQQGVPLVMLINELISNAIKHGGGDVELTFALEDKTVRLEVCDDGPGFASGFLPQEAANTGLELIESLARWDLQGETRYENRTDGGARVVVMFPLSDIQETTVETGMSKPS